MNDMFRMVKTEIWKLKRYHMIWAGVFLMLLSVVLTLFSTTAFDGTVLTFSFFTEQVVKNNYKITTLRSETADSPVSFGRKGLRP